MDAVKATGREQLVLAAFWTEICLAMPAIHALADGYHVFIVTDASGGVPEEAHDMAVRRMIALRRHANHMDGRDGRVAAGLRGTPGR